MVGRYRAGRAGKGVRRKTRARPTKPAASAPPADERLIFATNLRRAREAIGMSQRRLARESGISQRWMSQIENGQANVGVDNMALLAGLVCKSVQELLSPDAE